jgi:hypothetical protein
MLSNRMTEKRRLDTAAAAIVARMMTRRRDRVLFPLSPRKKTSETCEAMAEERREGEWRDN